MKQPPDIGEHLDSWAAPDELAATLLGLAGPEYVAAWRLGADVELVVVPEARDTRWSAQALLLVAVAGLGMVLLGQAERGALDTVLHNVAQLLPDSRRWHRRTAAPQPWRKEGYRAV